ncbi:hypothetical protein [Hymenobacter sp. YC55]|uniref:hypothetical protein n=1 Tax=Hymenobacter sp. YC55 TaxID=3034019 RepID=UPI0023F6371E|nr:hypothetical protein [Hymenobacter sp. YC55]MDF7814119.1 hypothetical protein [Hymenobacter sp. YC55]
MPPQFCTFYRWPQNHSYPLFPVGAGGLPCFGALVFALADGSTPAGPTRMEGKKYLMAFEQAYARKDATIEAPLVATLYLAASIAAGKAYDMAGARTYAKKGLPFEPMNPDLQQIATMN